MSIINIHEATERRHQEAIWVMDQDPQKVSSLSPGDLNLWITTLRIYVDTGMNLYSHTPDCTAALSRLAVPRDAIRKYYLDQSVISVIKPIKEIEGKEYQAWAETSRDIAGYERRLYEIFPHPTIAQRAKYAYICAISTADPESSASGLAEMELNLLSLGLREEIDFADFQTAYQMVKKHTTKNENWDRLTITSWWYAKVASKLGYPHLAINGLSNMFEGARKGGQNPIMNPLKDLLRPFFTQARKRSYNSTKSTMGDYVLLP